MKRKRIEAAELAFLRKQVEERYRSEGGTELEWRSYLPRYEDLNARIRSQLHGQLEVAISPNILRRLFWDTLEEQEASFNVVYLNAFARYVSQGAYDYRAFHVRLITDPGQAPTATTQTLETSSALGWIQTKADKAREVIGGTVALEARPSSSEMRTPTHQPPRDVTRAAASAPPSPPRVRSFMRPFLIASLYSGLLSFAFVLLFNEISGYGTMGRTGLPKLMVSWFGFTVFGHLALGIVLSFFTQRLTRCADERRFFRAFHLTLPFLFILTFYCRQLFVSSGWLVNGRASAGFFGQPDFETVAIALSLCLFISLFLRSIRHGMSRSESTPALQATLITLSCGTIFFSIAATYNILVSEHVIDATGSFIAPHIFSYRFPHPERLPLICFMIFIQTYLTLKFVAERSWHAGPAVSSEGTSSAHAPRQAFTLPQT